MKCSFCGNELESGATFCPACGTILSIDEPNEEENTTVAEPVDIYSNSGKKEEEIEYKAPEYVPPVLEEDPVLTMPYEPEEDDEDPFREMHPDEYDASSSDDYEQSDDEEDYEDYGDDMLVDVKKNKKGVALIAVLAVVLVAIIMGGIYAVNNITGRPLISKTTEANASVSDSAENKQDKTTDKSETKKPTKEEKTEESTDEDETTEEKTTEEEPSEKEPTSEKESSASVNASSTQSTTVPTTASTTAPMTAATTAPATKPAVAPTTAPTSARPVAPATTKPAASTAAPTTSAAAQLKKPSKTVEKFTVYATQDGVSLRYAPSTSAGRRLYLSVGADLVVTGEENGYYYVYSNRYGVNGWVNKSYTSKERPVAEKQQNVSGVVAPDTKSDEKTMYVNTKDALRLRKGPGTNYDVIRMISNDYPVVVKGSSSKAPGWVYVTDTTHGVSGWVSSSFLK